MSEYISNGEGATATTERSEGATTDSHEPELNANPEGDELDLISYVEDEDGGMYARTETGEQIRLEDTLKEPWRTAYLEMRENGRTVGRVKWANPDNLAEDKQAVLLLTLKNGFLERRIGYTDPEPEDGIYKTKIRKTSDGYEAWDKTENKWVDYKNGLEGKVLEAYEAMIAADSTTYEERLESEDTDTEEAWVKYTFSDGEVSSELFTKPKEEPDEDEEEKETEDSYGSDDLGGYGDSAEIEESEASKPVTPPSFFNTPLVINSEDANPSTDRLSERTSPQPEKASLVSASVVPTAELVAPPAPVESIAVAPTPDPYQFNPSPAPASILFEPTVSLADIYAGIETNPAPETNLYGEVVTAEPAAEPQASAATPLASRPMQAAASSTPEMYKVSAVALVTAPTAKTISHAEAAPSIVKPAPGQSERLERPAVVPAPTKPTPETSQAEAHVTTPLETKQPKPAPVEIAKASFETTATAPLTKPTVPKPPPEAGGGGGLAKPVETAPAAVRLAETAPIAVRPAEVTPAVALRSAETAAKISRPTETTPATIRPIETAGSSSTHETTTTTAVAKTTPSIAHGAEITSVQPYTEATPAVVQAAETKFPINAPEAVTPVAETTPSHSETATPPAETKAPAAKTKAPQIEAIVAPAAPAEAAQRHHETTPHMAKTLAAETPSRASETLQPHRERYIEQPAAATETPAPAAIQAGEIISLHHEATTKTAPVEVVAYSSASEETLIQAKKLAKPRATGQAPTVTHKTTRAQAAPEYHTETTAAKVKAVVSHHETTVTPAVAESISRPPAETKIAPPEAKTTLTKTAAPAETITLTTEAAAGPSKTHTTEATAKVITAPTEAPAAVTVTSENQPAPVAKVAETRQAAQPAPTPVAKTPAHLSPATETAATPTAERAAMQTAAPRRIRTRRPAEASFVAPFAATSFASFSANTTANNNDDDSLTITFDADTTTRRAAAHTHRTRTASV